MNEQVRFDNGGPAFPVADDTALDGMSLRDWFAGQALCGDMTSGNETWSNDTPQRILCARAELFYRLADAMIEARKAARE